MSEAMAASSIHTSLAKGSAITTMAKAASFRKEAPISLQMESCCKVSLSSTTMNCHGLLRLEEGDMRAAFSSVTTWSCESSSPVNFRMLRLFFIKSLKLFIILVFYVTLNLLTPLLVIQSEAKDLGNIQYMLPRFFALLNNTSSSLRSSE